MGETRKNAADGPMAGFARLTPPDLRIPGGWELGELTLGEREMRFWKPADPDAFLDDESSQESHGPTEDSPERNDIPFWQYLWPAAERMSRLVAAKEWETNRALELGAGIGLVGLAGLTKGIHLTFSDYQTPALELAAHNARCNGFENFETQMIDWFTPPTELRFPLVFGCEVIYEPAIHEPILNVLDSLLSEDGMAWLGDPGRSHVPAFLDRAQQRGYGVQLRDAAGNPRNEAVFGEFQLIELRRGDQRARMNPSA